jgi:hypothetical protein
MMMIVPPVPVPVAGLPPAPLPPPDCVPPTAPPLPWPTSAGCFSQATVAKSRLAARDHARTEPSRRHSVILVPPRSVEISPELNLATLQGRFEKVTVLFD